MDNSFLNYLLCLILLLILILYLSQNNNSFKKINKHNMHNMQKMSHHMKHNKLKYLNKLSNLQNVSNQNTIFRNTGMPIHRVGPVINFHQHFNKYNTNPTYTTVKGCGNPTGIPELGWRNMYISNYTNNEVKDEDAFAGISTRNYLNNMENVDNIYRK